MRNDVLTRLNQLDLGSFSLSSDLPYTTSGESLYLKNARRIYVDRPQVSVEPLIETLDHLTILTETQTLDVWFSTDAKVTPADLDTVLARIRSVRGQSWGDQLVSETVQSEYSGDRIIFRVEFRFRRVLPSNL